MCTPSAYSALSLIRTKIRATYKIKVKYQIDWYEIFLIIAIFTFKRGIFTVIVVVYACKLNQ